MGNCIAQRPGAWLAVIAALTAPTTVLSQQTSASSTTSSDLNEIVVVGIRASILQAQDIKRDAPTVVEAISSEDLGRFSDNSVSDALTRVAGIQVTKGEDGETGDAIAIRGLGSAFTVSTLNGRSLLTSGNADGSGIRGFNLDQIPTEVLNGVLIYKSSNAESVENGLAGLIDYQTLRPLDYQIKSGKNYYLSATAREDYDSNNKKTSPRFSGIAVYKNDLFGAYVSFIHSNERKRDDNFIGTPFLADIHQQAVAGGPVTTTKGVAAYNEVDWLESDIKTTRNTASGGLQVRPSDNLDISFDGLYNKYERLPRSRLGRDIFGPNYYSIYDGVFSPGGVTIENNRVVAVDSTKQTGGGYPVFLVADQAAPNTLKTYSVGGNVAWHNELWRVAADAAYSDVDYQRIYSTFYAYTGAAGGLGSSYDTRGGDIPTVLFSQGNYLDPSGYTNSLGSGPGPDYFAQNQFSKKNRVEAKLDFQRLLSADYTLKFGTRFEQTNENYRISQLEVASYQPPGFQIPAASIPALSAAFLNAPVLTTTYGFRFPGTNYYASCAVVPTICAATDFGKGSFAGGLPADPNQNKPSYFGEPGKDLQTFETSGVHVFRETTKALYAQVDGKGTLFGVKASGNLGLRAVRITELGTSYRGTTEYNNPLVATVIASNQSLIRAEHSYWEYLPSWNVKFSPREDLNLRASISRVVSLPDVDSLSPESNISYYDPNDPKFSVQNHGFGSTGNTALKPTSSWNYDLTGEYYTANKGALILSLFYKKISDFVLGQQTANVTLPGLPGLFDLSEPVNYSGAYARGFEIGGNQPFTFLPSPFDGFGLQANYTFVQSALDRLAGGKKYGIPGSSENNANAVAYYEKYGFGARVAFNYRSDYFLYLGSPAFNGNFVRYVKGNYYLDASLSYAFNKNLSVQLNGTNLTKTRQIQYNEVYNFPLAIYERPATYSLGITGSF